MRAPQREDFQQTLRARNTLRWHGWLIGGFMLLFTWAVSHFQLMFWGDGSLALRYLITLGSGYLVYLLVLHEWSKWVLLKHLHQKREDSQSDGDFDPGDVFSFDWSGGGGGGNGSDALGDVASGALEAVGAADEGAIVVVPVVAIFLLLAAALFGAGALLWLYFGSEVLLAVAVEMAFSVATARALMGAEKAGWFTAAVRLTWKPLLGALLCAVVLGLAMDHWLPQAQSLSHAVRLLKS